MNALVPHPAILVVDRALSDAETLQGRATRALCESLRADGCVVTEALSHIDGLATVAADAGLHAVVIEWLAAPPPGSATTRDLLRAVRARHAAVPVFLLADRRQTVELTEEIGTLADELIFLLEDTPGFVAGRVRAAAMRYLDALLPPFARALLRYERDHEHSWAAPGHQGGVAFTKSPIGRLFFDFYGEALFRTDMGIERTALGSLLAHSGPIGASEQYAARVFGAERSYSVVNGSSGANRTVIAACVGDGDVVLVDRNCHKSVEQGLAVSGGIPVFLKPSRNRYGIIGPIARADVAPDAIDACVAAHPLVARRLPEQLPYAVITNCTYDGLCYNAADVEARIGPRVDRLHFDEAWYGHARFHPLFEGRHAMRGQPADQAADGPTVFATQSTHKLLAALSQAAYIHVRDGRRPIEHGRFNEAYCLQATTSPLYPLLAANDVAAAMMDGSGGLALTRDAVREAVACRLALARVARQLSRQADWFFTPWNADAVEIDGTRVPFDEAPSEWLASSPEAWILRPGDPWHGFGDIADGWCMLDPTKLGIVCPGLAPDGTAREDGIPADLVTAFLTRRGIVPSRTTDHMVLFLFTIGVTKGKWGTLIHALLDFKRAFDDNAALDVVLPDLVAAHPGRYAARGLRDLAREMCTHLAETNQSRWQARACAELPRPVLTPRQAFQRLMRGEAERLPVSRMAGRISAVGVIPYPPGIPLVMPGECVGAATEPWLEYLDALQIWTRRFPGFEKEVEGAEWRDGEYHVYCVTPA